MGQSEGRQLLFFLAATGLKGASGDFSERRLCNPAMNIRAVPG